VEVAAVLAELEAALFALADTAAFKTCAKSGLMPHVRQGGNGNASVTTVASKFDGTGFEKAQMVQIQLPLSICGAEIRDEASVNGLGVLETGDEAEETRCTAGDIADSCGLIDPYPRFTAFGYKVTFGDDRRNRAWCSCFSTSFKSRDKE
jgi:hypothetical protein